MSAFVRTYARAFLGAAPAGYDVDAFLANGEALSRAVLREAKLKAFFSTPAVPAESKRRVLDDLGQKAGLDEFARRFFLVLLEKRRLLQAGAILSAIREESDRVSGVVLARVIVAAPIEGAEEEKIANALARVVGRRLRLTTQVDEKILGGFVARVGSEVFDASVSRAIEQFQKKSSEAVET